jgi:hypothetical protein
MLQEHNPPKNGASTRASTIKPHVMGRSNTNALSLPSMTRACGLGQKFASTQRTPQEQPEQLVLRGDTSPPSILVSLNYFDPLSEEVEEALEEVTHHGLPAPNPLAIQYMQQQQHLRQQQQK